MMRQGLALRLRACSSWSERALYRRLFSSHSYAVEPEARLAVSGLCGHPSLLKPSGFEEAATQARHKCEYLIDQLEKLPPSGKTLETLDEISDTLCSVLDVAELCRNVHEDPEFVESAREAFASLSSYMQTLNTDVQLHKSILKVSDCRAAADFTPEQKRMVTLLRQDFERSGIHLEAKDRARVVALQDAITTMGGAFMANANASRPMVEVQRPGLLSSLPPNIMYMIRKDSRKRSDGVLEVPTDPIVVNAILKWVQNPDLRSKVYIAAHAPIQENLAILDALIQARHQLASLLSFPSYAHLATADKVAKNPENVVNFLENLSAKLRPQVEQEMGKLRAAKTEAEGPAHGLPSTFYAWDRSFYTGTVKSREHDLDGQVISAYFSLDNCLRGLAFIFHRLYGMNLVEVAIAAGEAWSSDVRKLAVHHPQEGTMGFIYLDLHPRRNKYDHAAHFSVRCGRRLPSGEYQLPVVTLVCNFPRPSPNRPTLLSTGEVGTLFHEFGHSMHSVLSRTSFQHLSGTRCAIDFVETPSHLMEYWASDARVLPHFARHYATQEPIPSSLVKRLAQSKHMFSATETATQVAYSMLDQRLFGLEAGDPNRPSTTEMLAHAQNTYSSIPYAHGTAFQTHFGHLVGYGANYYSYIFARVFSAALWEKVFAKDPLNGAAGERYRRQVLVHGAALEPMDMLRTLLDGKEPCVDAFLKHISS